MATEDKSVFATLRELKELTVSYAKQETWEPVKGVGRFLKFGLPGAVLSAVGLLLLSLAMLRALQTTTGDTFAGKATWAPYLLTFAGLVLLCVLFGLAIGRGGDK
jgi:predicted cobalt transporter CbtA